MSAPQRMIGCGPLLLACLACICTNAATAAVPPPAEAFGKIPNISNVELNPKGNLLGWADNSGAEQKIVIFDLDANALKGTHNVGSGAKLRGLDWADDETLLIHVSLTHTVSTTARDNPSEWLRTIAVDAVRGEARILLMTDPERSWVTGARVVALRTATPKTVIMSSWDFSMTKKGREIDSRLIGGRKDSGWVYSLFEVSTRTGNGKLIHQGTHLTSDWIVDKNGNPVARSEWDAERGIFRLVAKDGGGWKDIYQQQDIGLGVYGLTSDESAIVAVGSNGEQLSKAWAIALDGSGAKVLLEDPHNDIESVIRDGYSWAPIGARVGGPEPKTLWLDSKAEARQKALTRTFAGHGVEIHGRSESGSRVLARVADHSTPATYYLVDFTKGTADIVGEDYPALEKVPLGEVRTISYKARDGKEIPAYVTTPPGAVAENLPLVVLPHGGPEARDEPDFDWLAQFLATRGYAVLQPQFRGSTGFGEAHRKAGYGEWGGLMQDDVTDGVKALIDQRLADPQRACIVGASYGGYAALAGAAFTPDLYACAASVNGVSDLPAMLGYESKQGGKESDALAYWRQHIGSAFDAKVINKSPTRAAARIRVPILLLHGVDDTVVPVAQAEAMSRKLQELGKPYKLVKLPGEDHWLSRSSSRVQVLKELESFLAAHLGTVPRKLTATAPSASDTPSTLH